MIIPDQLIQDDVFIDNLGRYRIVTGINPGLQLVKYKQYDQRGSTYTKDFCDKFWDKCRFPTKEEILSVGVDPWLLTENDKLQNILSGVTKTVLEKGADYIIFYDEPNYTVDFFSEVWDYYRLIFEEIEINDSVSYPTDPQEAKYEALKDFFFFPEKWEARIKKSDEQIKKNNQKGLYD